MMHTRWIDQAVLGLVVMLFSAAAVRGQEKPKEAAAPTQAKPAETEAAKQAKKEPETPKPRIAVFRLAGPVHETPKEESFSFSGEMGIPLETLVRRMDKAAKDCAVKAVVIVLDQPVIGSAQVQELRQAIGRIRAAGKEVIAQADSISSLGHYALLTAASRISVVPTADIWATGIYG